MGGRSRSKIKRYNQASCRKGAPDAAEWWDWYDNLPLLHKKYVSKNSVGQWYAGLTDEEKLCVNYELLTFAGISLSVSPTALLPMGGYEHDNDPQYWAPLTNSDIIWGSCEKDSVGGEVHIA